MSDADDALEYHRFPVPGKIAIVATKPCESVRDLSLAYSPGVAQPCLQIKDDASAVYNYTSRGNLVAVITNGTAVLGLGDIGPLAAKPVMEGKAVLFKNFADIDVFDLELNCESTEHFISSVEALAPTFGAINLEDIKAPECFVIEKTLQEKLDIPVFHDDQHGTAIIAAAALWNALELAGKRLEDIRLVIVGAGAAGIAAARLLVDMGLPREQLTMCDSVGVIYRGRKERMNPFKEEFAVETKLRTIADAMQGADVFFGVSKKDLITPAMLKGMADNPIVFALANPDPEIDYNTAMETRDDVIVATGRSDFPNQVNNVLGFPYILRGALDVRARGVNEAMKMAAVKALAALAKEPMPDVVRQAYGRHLSFGRDYLIPKPFDPRVLYWVAPAVAGAAMESGLARVSVDLDDYALRLKAQQNYGREILRGYHGLARRSTCKRIAFPEGVNRRVLRAAEMAYEEGICEPVLFGDPKIIEERARQINVDLKPFDIIYPADDDRFASFVDRYHQKFQRAGIARADAEREVRLEHVFASMLVKDGDIDGLIAGVNRNYPSLVRSVLQIIGLRKGCKTAAGLYLLSTKDRVFFFADTSINISMNEEKLAEIATMTAEFARSMDIEPRVAMLSFSNFGSAKHESATMVKRAVALVEEREPDLVIDGEMQADTATVSEILDEHYSFCKLDEPANVLIFPDMQSGNIAYKLLQRLGDARVVGPIILGLDAPAYVMQRHASVDEIFNMITVAVAQATLSHPDSTIGV